MQFTNILGKTIQMFIRYFYLEFFGLFNYKFRENFVKYGEVKKSQTLKYLAYIHIFGV